MRARIGLVGLLACASCAAAPPPAPQPPAVAAASRSGAGGRGADARGVGFPTLEGNAALGPPAGATSTALPPLPPPCATTPASPSSAPAPASSSATSEPPPGARDDDTIDDGVEAPAPPPTAATTSSPLDAISDADLEKKLDADPASLGTIALGSIHSGGLLFGTQMPPGDNWQVVVPAQSYGARETVEGLAVAINAVAARFPGTPKAFIGDVSRQGGGHFPPHVSHQGGRDVDMSYYLTGDAHKWYVTANAHNINLPRSWALVRAFITQTDVELVLMDRSVQRLMKDYARSTGEDAAWLDDIFQIDGKSQRPIIIHVPGHASHLHVRFFAAESRELGRRAYPILMRKHLIRPPTYYVDHVVRAGETIRSIAAREHVSVDAIKRANHTGSSVVVRGRTLKIPRAGGIERPLAKVVAPPRRLPPESALAHAGPNPCGGGAADGS